MKGKREAKETELLRKDESVNHRRNNAKLKILSYILSEEQCSLMGNMSVSTSILNIGAKQQ